MRGRSGKMILYLVQTGIPAVAGLAVPSWLGLTVSSVLEARTVSLLAVRARPGVPAPHKTAVFMQQLSLLSAWHLPVPTLLPNF